jgi:CheY-like chemotaxis protein
MQMPEMDGYELARAIRGRGMQLPIVAITAYAMSGERDRCMEAGCNDFITKPVRRDELLRIAAKHLRTSADAAASGA